MPYIFGMIENLQPLEPSAPLGLILRAPFKKGVLIPQKVEKGLKAPQIAPSEAIEPVPAPALRTKFKIVANPANLTKNLQPVLINPIQDINILGSNFRPLMEHQKRAITYLQESNKNNLGGCLFMEMRLGKTLTMLRHVIPSTSENSPTLIIAPYSAHGAWIKEFKLEGVESYIQLVGEKKNRIDNLKKSYSFYLLNFEVAHKLDIHLYEWNNLIIDESIKIANPKNKIGSYITEMMRPVKNHYSLTGLPCPESPAQYFNQCILPRKRVMGFVDYKKWYYSNFEKNDFSGKFEPKESFNHLMKLWLNDNTFQLSKEEANLGNKLITVTREVVMGHVQRVTYNSMKNSHAAINDITGQKISTSLAVGKLTQLRNIAGGFLGGEKVSQTIAKVEELKYLVTNELHNEPILIWCARVDEVKFIYNELNKLAPNKINYITGDVDPIIRERLRLSFQAGEFNILICTFASNAKGGDWSKASAEIMYSHPFSFDEFGQAKDRIVNMRTRDSKLIIHLVNKESIDEDILDLLLSKKPLTKEMFFANLMAKQMKDYL